MKEETKKAIEDLDVIKSIINKTRCDMSEISSFFIVMGLLNIFHALFLIIMWKANFNDSYIFYYRVSDIAVIVITIGILIFYYLKIKKKNNLISTAIIQIWGFITLLIPILWKLGTIGSFMYTNKEILTETAAVRLSMDIHNMQNNFQVLIIMIAIITVGLLLQKKSILIMSAAITALYFTTVIITSIRGELYEFHGTFFPLLAISYIIINFLSVFLLGIILKLDGRKKMNGVE